MVYCGAATLPPHPKAVSACPEDGTERPPSHTETRVPGVGHQLRAHAAGCPERAGTPGRRGEPAGNPQKTLAQDRRFPPPDAGTRWRGQRGEAERRRGRWRMAPEDLLPVRQRYGYESVLTGH